MSSERLEGLVMFVLLYFVVTPGISYLSYKLATITAKRNETNTVKEEE